MQLCPYLRKASPTLNGALEADIEIDENVDECHHDFRRNENNNWPPSAMNFPCLQGPSRLTYPLQLFTVAMAQQVLQHSQQIGDNIQPIRKHGHALVHLQVRPHSLVHGLEVRLDPEDLWGVEDGAVEVDVDAEGEKLADLHVDLLAREKYLPRQGDLVRDLLAGFYRGCHELLEERGLITVLGVCFQRPSRGWMADSP